MGPEAPRVVTDRERDLISGLRAGDEQALADVIASTQGLALSTGLRITGNRQDAEEVAEDVWVRLWRNRSNLNPDLGLKGIVNRISYQRSIDVVRRRRRRRLPTSSLIDNLTEDESASDNLSEQIERAIVVRNAVDTLPPAQQRVIRLSYWGGFTQEEIAQMLHTPPGTIKKRVTLAMSKLRRALAETNK